jgi:hypothetical protein
MENTKTLPNRVKNGVRADTLGHDHGCIYDVEVGWCCVPACPDLHFRLYPPHNDGRARINVCVKFCDRGYTAYVVGDSPRHIVCHHDPHVWARGDTPYLCPGETFEGN